jgi:cell wall-associated NlpC family hydrolase
MSAMPVTGADGPRRALRRSIGVMAAAASCLVASSVVASLSTGAAAQTVPTLPPVGAVPVAAGSTVPGSPVPPVVSAAEPAPSTTAAPRVVPDPLADAALTALAALKGRPSAVVPVALPQAGDPTRLAFDVTSSNEPAPLPVQGATPVAAVNAGAGSSEADPYGAARMRVAQLVASRVKGASAADLEAVWSRTDPRRMTAVFAALSQVGTLYRYTGNEPGGFDCSGLTSWSWAQAGVKLPRISTDQINAAAPRTPDQVQPGDLVWRPGHIMMSLGGSNLTVDSPQTGKRVTVRSWGKVQRFGSPIG